MARLSGSTLLHIILQKFSFMLKNYFKTAIRNFIRHGNNSVINIAGLTVGFTAFLLIFLVIKYEKSFDDFHPDKNNIYRVVRIGKNINVKEYRAGVPFPVTPTLRTEFPQLKNAAAIFSEYNVQVDVTAPDGSVPKKFKEPGMASLQKRNSLKCSASLWRKAI